MVNHILSINLTERSDPEQLALDEYFYIMNEYANFSAWVRRMLRKQRLERLGEVV